MEDEAGDVTSDRAGRGGGGECGEEVRRWGGSVSCWGVVVLLVCRSRHDRTGCEEDLDRSFIIYRNTKLFPSCYLKCIG